MTDAKKKPQPGITQTEALTLLKDCRVERQLFNWPVNRFNDGGLLMVAEAAAKSDRQRNGDGTR